MVATTKTAARNGVAKKTNGAVKTIKAAPKAAPTSVASRTARLEAEVKQLRADYDELNRKFDEFMKKLKLAAVQQLMQRPDVQEQLQNALLAKLEHDSEMKGE
jgi:predicted nuclease with TOPRIM domain